RDRPPRWQPHHRGRSADGARPHSPARRDHRRPRGPPGTATAIATPRGRSCMRICVVGCGAVGSLFAANLATLDDVDVWAFDLNKSHVDAINQKGLQLLGAGEVLGRLQATIDPASIPACDFGIVATKAMHADAAIAATAHAFADAAVASVMNGVGNDAPLASVRTAVANEETLAPHVERVIRGTTFPAGKLLDPGVVQWDVKGDTTVGPLQPRAIPGETL